jgi:hypothetical protein
VPLRQFRVGQNPPVVVFGRGVVEKRAIVGAAQQELRQDPGRIADTSVDGRRERRNRFLDTPLAESGIGKAEQGAIARRGAFKGAIRPPTAITS